MHFTDYSTETLTPCPDYLCVVPYRPYVLTRKQFGSKHKLHVAFEVNKRAGALLKPSAKGPPQRLDNGHIPLLKNFGTKVAYVIQFAGYQSFKPQKYAHLRCHGVQIPNDCDKVLHQIAEVMEAFIQSIQHEENNPLRFSAVGGIALDDLHLLEIQQVAKASFQPIFAVKKELAFWNRDYVVPPMP